MVLNNHCDELRRWGLRKLRMASFSGILSELHVPLENERSAVRLNGFL
jgi:hypothetical protein